MLDIQMIQEYRNGLVGNILAGDFGVSLVENFHLGAITVLLASCRVVRMSARDRGQFSRDTGPAKLDSFARLISR